MCLGELLHEFRTKWRAQTLSQLLCDESLSFQTQPRRLILVLCSWYSIIALNASLQVGVRSTQGVLTSVSKPMVVQPLDAMFSDIHSATVWGSFVYKTSKGLESMHSNGGIAEPRIRSNGGATSFDVKYRDEDSIPSSPLNEEVLRLSANAENALARKRSAISDATCPRLGLGHDADNATCRLKTGNSLRLRLALGTSS